MNTVITLYMHTADQMWCLARLLPFMIGHLVPEDDKHWHNFLLLLTIVDYAFAPVISPNEVAFLNSIIEQHNFCFKHLYPDSSMIPKLHYILHIAEWILKYTRMHNYKLLPMSCSQHRIGPLGRHWCMRYEAKHAYFKKLARNAYNFRNIAKTLAKRHQRLMCYYLNSKYLGDTTSVGRGL